MELQEEHPIPPAKLTACTLASEQGKKLAFLSESEQLVEIIFPPPTHPIWGPRENQSDKKHASGDIRIWGHSLVVAASPLTRWEVSSM